MYWLLEGETEVPLNDGEWVPLGEGISEEDMQLAAVTLFERRIECHWAYLSTEIDEMRRVLEADTGGRILMVKPQDRESAWEVVQRHLKPIFVYDDIATYLVTRSNEDLCRVLDFESIWPPSALQAAQMILLSRGVAYPPNGASAGVILPLLCFMLGALFGPLGLFMRVRINWKDRMPSGGERPHYSNRAKDTANNFLIAGLVIWGMFLVFSVVARIP